MKYTIKFDADTRSGEVQGVESTVPVAFIPFPNTGSGDYEVTIERVRAPLPHNVRWDGDEIVTSYIDYDVRYKVDTVEGDRGIVRTPGRIVTGSKHRVPGFVIKAFQAEGLLP